MPLAPIRFTPGIQVEQTPTLNQGGWTDCNRIRWRAGLPEQLGGWVKYFATRMPGIPRTLHTWESLASDHYLGIGTDSSLLTLTNGVLVDRTPFVSEDDVTPDFSTTIGETLVTVGDVGSNTSDGQYIGITVPVSVGGIVLQGTYEVVEAVSADVYTIDAASAATATVANGGAVPEFDTTNGSPVVLVTLADHGYGIGDTFTVQISTAVGGLTLLGDYTVQTVPDADTFTFSDASNASSTANAFENSGDAHLVYYVTSAPIALTTGGYGVGGYGLGPYGIGGGAVVSPHSFGVWSLDNWGEILIANVYNGGLYLWSPSGADVEATAIPNAPTINIGAYVATPQQILVAYGSETGSVQDPLLIRWSDVSDYTVWTASSTNQAGSFRLSSGSRIVTGMQAPQRALVWTDLDLWSITYIGPPFVYGFQKIATQCGAISQNSVAVLDDVVYWLSPGEFNMMSGGGVVGIPCPVWDALWQDLDQANADKITAASNSEFNEVAWYYPSLSGGTGEIDRYVKYNTAEKAWDIGALDRTAWVDQSMLGPPIGGDTDGFLYQHEVGTTADGAAMGDWIQSGRVMIAEGDSAAFLDQVIPDFKWGEFGGDDDSEVTMTLTAYSYPNTAARTKGPYTVTVDDPWFTTRLRGAQLAMRIDGVSGFWRLGNCRARIAPAGRRP
jgi:hypothetical protein